MATQTTNYGLKKPAYSDTADIGVINSNMDIIDVKMKEIEDKAGSGGGGTSVTVDSELSTTSENPVQNKAITQELNKKGTYSKPTGGIQKTDLSSDVQTSLGKADTALQEHQDISGKADKTEVTALSNSISDAWNNATAYTAGQYCIYNNALWKCLVANTNTEPAEGTYWTKVSVANEIASVNSSLATTLVSPTMAEGMELWQRTKSYKKGNQIICSIGIVNSFEAGSPVHVATIPYLPLSSNRVFFNVFNTADNNVNGHGYIDIDGKIYFNVNASKNYYCCNFTYFCK